MINFSKIQCTGCSACASSCNRDVIVMGKDDAGFPIPLVANPEKCVECGICESVCPSFNPKTEKKNPEEIAIIAQIKDENIRKESASGGMFSAIAITVLKKGGMVYGAAYDYENEILKCSSTNECSLDALKKSKYVESYMGKTFKKVGLDLKENRFVLFCGTPCQCRGLRSYINCMNLSSQKLLVVRFICHGVPSHLFLTEYKHWMEKKRKSKIVAIDFRPKTYGWRTQSIALKFKNKTVYKAPCTCDFYLLSFFNNILLKKCCYECNFDKEDSADMTIADFWGIHYYHPKNKDQEGLSVVLAHSEKGKNMIEKIKSNCSIELLPTSAIKYLFGSRDYLQSKQKRQLLIKEVQKKGYMTTVLKYFAFQIQKNKFKWFLSRLKHFVKSFV